ncbi:DUF4123 domain-containing protein [Pragia fontium]|uniref:DUF4123 domain-containing protein n=1 Tax=Pragia fontium TaxID=82985 RepID=UPI00064B0EF4|nr:DUF4123 domain-containing protein [Pragia fontium]AKJ42104.1 hypothetical protein QQ39_08380 [Pragia fontium]
MTGCKLFSSPNDDTLSSLQQYWVNNKFLKLYILIEPRANYAPLAFWSDYVESDRIWIIRDPQDHTSTDSECLQLLSLSENELDLLNSSVVQSGDPDNGYSICGWLFSSKNGEDIQQHLINMLVLKYQGEAYQFRYYDRRVMGRLIHILNDFQLSKLLGVINSWQFLNHYRHLTIIEHQPEMVIGENPIKLTRFQWQRLSTIEWFNRSVSAYHSLFPHPLSIQQEQILDEALEKSEQYNITNGADIVTLGQFSLIYGRQLLANPLIQENIKKSIIDNIPLIDLFAQESDEFWQSIIPQENS